MMFLFHQFYGHASMDPEKALWGLPRTPLAHAGRFEIEIETRHMEVPFLTKNAITAVAAGSFCYAPSENGLSFSLSLSLHANPCHARCQVGIADEHQTCGS